MAKKIRDVAVKTGEYQDRNTGETKGRWMNVGSLMQNEDDQSLFIILDRAFNPAGIANPENRSGVILSCFKIQDRDQNNNQRPGGNNQGGGYDQSQSQGGQSGSREMDDEIPL